MVTLCICLALFHQQIFLMGISVTSTSLTLYHAFPLGASMMLAALATEAGLPGGVLNVVHGTNDIVNYICDDDDIKALSFVGSSTVS
ncbi:hypothetical protein Pint_27726 [Pistacia integerrima]|uniref:Uncharacterized protein n=1 Tax=Pistacia integerrima TaxID=434235 RepID=A0ACC0YR39_9ROSI|nr:hypothetical protein Pint_27726 [Pistacia integerrima]